MKECDGFKAKSFKTDNKNCLRMLKEYEDNTDENFTKMDILDVLKDCGDDDMVYMWWGPMTIPGLHIFRKEKILRLLENYKDNEDFYVFWSHEAWPIHEIYFHGKEDNHFDIDSMSWESWLNRVNDMGIYATI